MTQQTVDIVYGPDHCDRCSPRRECGVVAPLMRRDHATPWPLAFDENDACARKNHQTIEETTLTDDSNFFTEPAQCNDTTNQLTFNRTFENPFTHETVI